MALSEYEKRVLDQLGSAERVDLYVAMIALLITRLHPERSTMEVAMMVNQIEADVIQYAKEA